MSSKVYTLKYWRKTKDNAIEARAACGHDLMARVEVVKIDDRFYVNANYAGDGVDWSRCLTADISVRGSYNLQMDAITVAAMKFNLQPW